MKNLKPTVVSAMVALAIVLSLALCACGINSDSVPMIETTSISTTTETTEVTVETITEATSSDSNDFYTKYIGVAGHNRVVCYDSEAQIFGVNYMMFDTYGSDGIESLVLFGIEAPIEDLVAENYEIVNRKEISDKVYLLEIDVIKERFDDGSYRITPEGSITLYGDKIIELNVVSGN